ncbi:MAG: hypothetical protein AB1384_04550 [Actinomycetota bacterium]
MKDMESSGTQKSARGRRYRDTVNALRSALQPLEPGPEFSRHLEELCESMGARELFDSESVGGEDSHRRIIIDVAIFSALPFVGVAAYAIRRHMLQRRALPVGV